MARQRLGVIEAQYVSQVLIADRTKREELAAQDTTPKDDARLMSVPGIRAVAKYIPDEHRLPDSVMLDTVLRDYWRMQKPSKLALLKTYRSRCGMTLPDHW